MASLDRGVTSKASTGHEEALRMASDKGKYDWNGLPGLPEVVANTQSAGSASGEVPRCGDYIPNAVY